MFQSWEQRCVVDASSTKRPCGVRIRSVGVRSGHPMLCPSGRRPQWPSRVSSVGVRSGHPMLCLSGRLHRSAGPSTQASGPQSFRPYRVSVSLVPDGLERKRVAWLREEGQSLPYFIPSAR